MYLENIVDEDPSSKTSEIVGDNVDEDFSFVTRFGSGKVKVKSGNFDINFFQAKLNLTLNVVQILFRRYLKCYLNI